MVDPSAEMPCDEAELLISRRIDGELHASDTDRLDAHLSSCDTCRETLSDWQDHSHQINAGLDNLWSPASHTKPIGKNETRIRKLARTEKSEKKIKPCMWVPIGMIASQFAAFLILGVYCLLFPQPAEAPHNIALPEPRIAPMTGPEIPDIEEVRRMVQPKPLIPIAGPIIAAPRPSVPCEFCSVEINWPATKPWEHAEPSEPVVLASFDREPLNLIRADNVWSLFQVETHDGALLAGKLALLSDSKSARAFVQIVSPDGSVREIAADKAHELEPELRGIVTRFIERSAQKLNAR